jgi:hypothetical protein
LKQDELKELKQNEGQNYLIIPQTRVVVSLGLESHSQDAPSPMEEDLEVEKLRSQRQGSV